MSQLTYTTPNRQFKDHESAVTAVAVFPDRQHMITGSKDKMLRLWDLKTGVVLKKMAGHSNEVWALAVSLDGRLLASGDCSGEVITWTCHRESLAWVTQASIKAHSGLIYTLDFSPDGTVLATGSNDFTTKLWNTKTGLLQGHQITCSGSVRCVRYSPSGVLLAIATDSNIEIYHADTTRQCITKFKGHTQYNISLVWTPDGTRLISAGSSKDPSIREWDASTWQQVGDPWTGHAKAVAIHPTGTLIASASYDNHVRLWSLLDRKTIAIFACSSAMRCVTFSMDGKHIFSGGNDKQVSEWAVPEDVLPKDPRKDEAKKARCSDLKILAIEMTIRNACITGDLTTAEQLLTQEIDIDANSHISYANRSFVMARQLDWDRALHDASKSVAIQPSFSGYISKGFALCGKQQIREAMTEFDLAFTSTDGDPMTTQFLFLIKAIALFNANSHEEAMRFVQELASRPNANPLASRVVEAYLRVQLGIIAMASALYKDAVDHFTAAVNAGAFFSKSDIHSMYEDFVVLFGWDLKSLWQIANQQRCHALIRGGQFGAALESYRYMIDMSDEPTKAIFLAWIPALNEEWRNSTLPLEILPSHRVAGHTS